jgi:ABC-type dipeptide/oligopeptide/nickel transport system permease component
VVQALALFTAAVIIVMNLAIDVAYAYLDPRVRLGQKAVV